MSAYYDFFSLNSNGGYNCLFQPDYHMLNGVYHPSEVKAASTSHLKTHLEKWHPKLFSQAQLLMEKGQNLDKLLQQQFKVELKKKELKHQSFLSFKKTSRISSHSFSFHFDFIHLINYDLIHRSYECRRGSCQKGHSLGFDGD